jgi:oligopeptide/dipeptide ABC transporter ATP-binding protein
VLALGLAGAPSFARLVHTLSASIAGRDFVAAAAVAGVSKLRILLRHLVPNMGEQLAINIMLSMGGTLLSFAALSFLGIGVRAPDYDWGLLLNQGVAAIYRNPAGALAPAVAVIVAGLGFNLFGEGAGQVFGHQQTTLPYKTRPKALAARPDRRQAAGGDDLLVIENLSVSFPTPTGWLTPVRGVNLTIRTGESVGIVGESGAGKSLTALAAAALIERPGSVRADRLEFLGLSLTAPLGRHRRRELGTTMAMVFQDPMTSLNPSLRVGTQLTEGAIQHQGLRRRDALARALAKLKDVRLRRPEQRIGQYPHELSGGMRQRVMIAMGLMGSLKLLIADEPTTALDATVQAQVLDVIRDVRANEGAALMLVSHDIGVVTEACDRVLVMYAGRIIEDLPAAELFQGARHPYTRALLETVPDMESDTRAPLAVIPGRPPDPREFPPGCAFAARCALANETCLANDPVLERCGPDHLVACWHPLALTGEPSSAGQSEAVAA